MEPSENFGSPSVRVSDEPCFFKWSSAEFSEELAAACPSGELFGAVSLAEQGDAEGSTEGELWDTVARGGLLVQVVREDVISQIPVDPADPGALLACSHEGSTAVSEGEAAGACPPSMAFGGAGAEVLGDELDGGLWELMVSSRTGQ